MIHVTLKGQCLRCSKWLSLVRSVALAAIGIGTHGLSLSKVAGAIFEAIMDLIAPFGRWVYSEDS